MAALLNSLFFVFEISFLPKVSCHILGLYCEVVQWDIMYLVCIAGYCLNVTFKCIVGLIDAEY